MGESLEIVIKGDLGGGASGGGRSMGKRSTVGADMVVDLSKPSLSSLGAALGTALGGPGGSAMGGMIGAALEDSAAIKALNKAAKVFHDVGLMFSGPAGWAVLMGKGLKKALDNSELAKGVKSFIREGWGALGDSILYGIYKIYESLIENWDDIVQFAKDPVKYTFEAAWEQQLQNLKDAWQGALDIADVIEGWGHLKTTTMFGTRMEVKDLFPPGVWGTVKILDMFHDRKILYEDIIDGFGKVTYKKLFASEKVGMYDMFGTGWKYKTLFGDDRLTMDKVFDLSKKWNINDMFGVKRIAVTLGIDDIDTKALDKLRDKGDKLLDAIIDYLQFKYDFQGA